MTFLFAKMMQMFLLLQKPYGRIFGLPAELLFLGRFIGSIGLYEAAHTLWSQVELNSVFHTIIEIKWSQKTLKYNLHKCTRRGFKAPHITWH